MLIAIYTGYSPHFTNDNYKDPEISKNIGGSEYAVIYLSQEFAKLGHEVYVANTHIVGTRESPGIVKCSAASYEIVGGSVTYCSFNELNKLCLNREIDMLIISRYINAFMHCFIRAKKIYLWLHDVIIHDAYQGQRLVGSAGPFTSNIKSISGISAQTEWHLQTLKQIYAEYPNITNKLFLAPNGVDQEIIDASAGDTGSPKEPGTFIYASHHSRGLQPLLKIWPHIVEKYLSIKNISPKLYIYGEKIPETDALVHEANAFSRESTITVFPKTPHLQLFKKMQECEFWIYPTSFPETFCMLALEAQLAGCKCICSDSGALKNTMNGCGVIMPPESTINDWVNAVINYDEMTTFSPQKQIESTREQSWRERALMWIRKCEEDSNFESGIERVLSEKFL